MLGASDILTSAKRAALSDALRICRSLISLACSDKVNQDDINVGASIPSHSDHQPNPAASSGDSSAPALPAWRNQRVSAAVERSIASRL